ncbi:hypothetical protein J5N97_021566 [Dioscorea zingiberensis]|uniref:Uncharacterized protein n=1 Tax=Dioscorea zingiberensis TaxID=325984 RepID=A0A9D5H9T3_9LILI|nr:hypothetical protein J5N97_021566 [Dioscorea zingiberensis]
MTSDNKTHAGQNPSPETHLLAGGGDGDIKGGVDRIYPQSHVTEENPMAGAGESRPVWNPDWCYTINIARCTKRERRELKEKLSWELQQVQSVMRWVDASSTGNLTRLPPKKRRKKEEDRRSESEKGLAAMMRKCLEIVNKLRRQKGANWFNAPVDADRLGLYDYHQFIKTPMDLGTVKEKLTKGSYRRPSDFAADVKLTFDNAMLYNAPDHLVHQLAGQLLSKFQKMYYPAYEVYRKRTSDEDGEVMMTDKEKKELMVGLQNLDDKAMNEAIQMMRRQGVELKTDGDEVEVELEALDNATLWQLKHFLLAVSQGPEPITTTHYEINNTDNKINSIDNVYNNNKLDDREIEKKKADSGSSSNSDCESSSSNSSSGNSSSSSSSDSEISLVNDSVQETTLPP